MTAINWGAWMRFDFALVIDSGAIPAGTPVKISKRTSWLPSWLSSLFTGLDSNTAVTEWPRPGLRFDKRVQAVSFERGSTAEHSASFLARRY